MNDDAKTLNHAILAILEQNPGRTCFEIKYRGSYSRISYRYFRTLTFRLANYFMQQGISEGGRVAIVASNSLEWMVSYMACLLTGGTVVVMRSGLPPNQVNYILDNSQANLVVVDSAERARGIAPFQENLPHLKKILVINSARDLPPDSESFASVLGGSLSFELYQGVQRRAEAVEAEALAALHYTTGQNGQPRGTMFSQRQRLQSMRTLRQWLQFNRDDLIFAALPWGWAASLEFSLYGFLTGVANALPESPESLIENMQETSPTTMLATPYSLENFYNTIINDMTETDLAIFNWAISISKRYHNSDGPVSDSLEEEHTRADMTFFNRIRGKIGGRLRHIYAIGATLPEKLTDFVVAVGLMPLSLYNFTEAGGFPTISTPAAHRHGSCGQVAPNFQIRLTDDNKVLIKSETVTQGYWHYPEESAQLIDDEGWLHSYDLGYFDDDGYLYLTGRKAIEPQLLLSSGRRVVPSRIERALMSSPYIHQTAVFGEGRQFVTALIVPDLEALTSRMEGRDLADTSAAEAGRPLRWLWQQENNSNQVVATTAHARVKKILDEVIGEINQHLDVWEQVRVYSLLEQAYSAAAKEMEALLPGGRDQLEEKYSEQIEAMYPRPPKIRQEQITEVQISPERLRAMLEKENILDAWMADAGIGFLFRLARTKQIDAPSIVHICDVAASIAQMESEEKPLSTALIVGNPVQVARLLPPGPVQLIRRDHIRRMRQSLVSLAKMVDGLVLGYLVDKYGFVRGIHKLDVPNLSDQSDLLLGPQFGLHAAISQMCDTVVFFVPTGGRQVRVFADGQLVGRYSNGDWSPDSMPRIRQTLDQLTEARHYDSSLVRRLLRCAFRMSEENLGAIFILGNADLVLEKSDAPEISYFANILGANLSTISDQALINFAKQDGATVIDESGYFRSCMVLLRPRTETKAEIGPGKGARHSSAAKMSAEANCLAITVSQDGPITIYESGQQIMSL